MKRVVKPELLDSDEGTPAEIEAGLADLRMVNRWFGGARVMRLMVERVAAQSGLRRLELLDVGAASGDVARAVQRALAARGVEVAVTLLDRAEGHLGPVSEKSRAAPGRPAGDGRAHAGGGGAGGRAHAGGGGADGRAHASLEHARRVVGDALALPFREKSFDVVGCSLLAHHLEPDEVVGFVNEALRVARVAVLINDLVRSRRHLALVYAGMPLYRSRLTRHDGPASVRRAYTPGEMRALLARSAARRVEIRRHYLCRMGVIAWA